MNLIVILASVLFLIIGVAVGYFIKNAQVQKDLKDKEGKASDIIEKAKADANDIKYKARKEAKEIAKEEKDKLDREVEKKQNELKNQEREVAKKEATLDRKIEDHEKEVKVLKEKEIEFEVSKKLHEEEIVKLKNKQNEFNDRLGQVAQMTKEEAKTELLKAMEEAARVDFAKELRRIEEETREEAEAKS